MERKIDVLIVEPGKAPRPAEIEDTVEAAEKLLGGTVQVGFFVRQKALLMDMEDKRGLAPNRRIPGTKEVINGTFLLCGIPEDGCGLAPLTPLQQKEFQDTFSEPGEFMTVGSTVFSAPDDVADKVYSLWDSMKNGESIVLTKWGGADRSVQHGR